MYFREKRHMSGGGFSPLNTFFYGIMCLCLYAFWRVEVCVWIAAWGGYRPYPPSHMPTSFGYLSHVNHAGVLGVRIQTEQTGVEHDAEDDRPLKRRGLD